MPERETLELSFVADTSPVDRAIRQMDRFEQSVESTSKVSSKSAQSVLGLSRAFQDVSQGGLAAGLNNIEQIFVGLPGKLSALAGPATIIGTAAYLAYQNWDALMGAIGQRVRVPPVDTSSLEGLQRRLKEIGDQIDDLRGRGLVSPGDVGRLMELESAERELKQEAEARKKIEELGRLRSESQEATAKAFTDALKETGAKGLLDELEKLFVESAVGRTGVDPNNPDPRAQKLAESARRLGKKQFADLVLAMDRGNQAAFDALIDLSDSAFGRTSEFSRQLRQNSPRQLKLVKEAERAAREAEDQEKENERARRDIQDLADRGAENEAKMFEDVAGTVGGSMESSLRAAALAAAAKSDTTQAKVAAQKGLIEDAVRRMYPTFAEIPEVLGRIVDDVGAKVVADIDALIEDLADKENLTRRQAARRLAQQEADRRREASGRLAGDEFRALAERMAADARLRGVRPTQDDIEQTAQQAQEYFAQAGLTPQQQARAGALLNNPNAFRQFPGLVGAMRQGGFDEATAVRNALGSLERAGGGNVNAWGEVVRAINEFIAGQRELMAMQAQMGRQAAFWNQAAAEFRSGVRGMAVRNRSQLNRFSPR